MSNKNPIIPASWRFIRHGLPNAWNLHRHCYFPLAEAISLEWKIARTGGES